MTTTQNRSNLLDTPGHSEVGTMDALSHSVAYIVGHRVVVGCLGFYTASVRVGSYGSEITILDPIGAKKGCTVTVYRPELHFGGEIVWSHVNHSSSSGSCDIVDTSASMVALQLAVLLAARYDTVDHDYMEALREDQQRLDVKMREGWALQEEVNKRNAAKLATYVGHRARITENGKVHTGEIVRDGMGTLTIVGRTRINWNGVAKVEVQIGSKFGPYSLLDIEFRREAVAA